MGIFDSTTTTKPKMFGPSKNLLKDVLKDATGYYNSGKAGSVFTKPTTVGFGKDIKTGLGGLSALAGANSNGAGISGQAQSIIDNGGFNQGQMDAKGSIKDLTNNGLLNEILNSKNGFTADQDAAYQNLQGAVNNNSADLQNTFDAGGFDAKQNAAYDALNNQTTGNNSVLQGTFDAGGLTGDMNDAMAGLKGTVLPNTQTWQNTIDQGGLTTGQKLVQDRNRATMSDPFDVNANPAYAAVRERALAEAQMGMDAQAAKAGRYGGASSQTIAARERGNLAADMDLNEYRSWQNRGDQAANNLFSGDQTGTGNQLALAQGQQSGLAALAGLSQQGLGNQLGINSAQQAGLEKVVGAGQAAQGNKLAQNSAIQGGYNNIVNTGGQGVNQNSNAITQKAALEAQLFNMENAGLDRMGQAYDLAQQPARTQLEVGGLRDQQRQNVRNDEIRQFDAQNPMNIYQQFMALANGAPTGTTTQTNPSLAQMLTGGGLGLAALASAF